MRLRIPRRTPGLRTQGPGSSRFSPRLLNLTPLSSTNGSCIRLTFPFGGFDLGAFDLFGRFGGDHFIGLSDCVPQLVEMQRIQPMQHHPLVTPHIWCRANVLALDQVGEDLWRALKAQPRTVEANDGENLPSDFEAEIIAPLQVFLSPWK